MSQIKHRQRLRELEAREEAARNGMLSTFKAQPDAIAALETAGDDASIPLHPVVPAAPSEQPPIHPMSVSTTGMNPNQLRAHAKHAAELLSQLPPAQYQEALKSLEQQNNTLYSIVVDELNNMADQAQQAEAGDGYNLSAIAGGVPLTPQILVHTAPGKPEEQIKL